MLASKVTFAPQLRGTLARARSPRLDQAYRGASEVLTPISSTNTSRSASRPSATHLSHWHPPIFFSGPAQAPEHPGNRRVADRNSVCPLQELAPLGQGRLRMLLEVRLQKLPRPFVQFRFGAGAFLRNEGSPLTVARHVALDRGDAHAEGAGGLDLGHPPLDGLDDLLS